MCEFCEVINKRSNLLEKNGASSCFFDQFPVTRFHMLIIPNRHIETYHDLSITELTEVHRMVIGWSKKLQKKDPSITGWNIGWNCKESAGQTVKHAHCHLIPRRDGDIDNPIGGVRGVIPDKRIYK